MPGHLLIVFVKNPVPGQVKTRLGKDIGMDRAAGVYARLLAHTAQEVLVSQLPFWVFYGDEPAEEDLWTASGAQKRLAQKGDDLGQRMQHAFALAFEAGYESVTLLGSDCPQLNADHLQDSRAALQSADLVVGPAEDGGYYLIGMKKPLPLFADIVWSTPTVLDSTLAKAKALNLEVALLDTLSDLDTESDLKRFPQFA